MSVIAERQLPYLPLSAGAGGGFFISGICCDTVKISAAAHLGSATVQTSKFRVGRGRRHRRPAGSDFRSP